MGVTAIDWGSSSRSSSNTFSKDSNNWGSDSNTWGDSSNSRNSKTSRQSSSYDNRSFMDSRRQGSNQNKKECFDKYGIYRGKYSENRCIRWNELDGHRDIPNWTELRESFGDTDSETIRGDHNYCRKAKTDIEPYCYTKNGNYLQKSTCDMEYCPLECWGQESNHYLGQQSVDECVNWNQQTKYPWFKYCSKFGIENCPPSRPTQDNGRLNSNSMRSQSNTFGRNRRESSSWFGSSFGSSSNDNKQNDRDATTTERTQTTKSSRGSSFGSAFGSSSNSNSRSNSRSNIGSSFGSDRNRNNNDRYDQYNNEPQYDEGDYNFCRSTHAEERPFCVNSRDQKIECLKIKECPAPQFSKNEIDERIKSIENEMIFDAHYKWNIVKLAEEHSDVIKYFIPKQLSCSNATIYGAFAAYVVGNQRELDMLEACEKDGGEDDKLHFSLDILPIMCAGLHIWNIICFFLIFFILNKLIITPIDSKVNFGKKKVKPNSNYKMNQYLNYNFEE